MSFFRKCLALSSLVAVLSTPAYAAVIVEPEFPDPAVEADLEHFDAALKQSQEDRWWAWAAIQEWNKAVAENERQARAESASRRPREPRRVGVASAPSSGRCGGDLPPCYVMERESGGSLTAENPVSTASGKWQFLDSTWGGFGGYSHAADAPESVQDEHARLTWNGGRGCSHWSACG